MFMMFALFEKVLKICVLYFRSSYYDWFLSLQYKLFQHSRAVAVDNAAVIT